MHELHEKENSKNSDLGIECKKFKHGLLLIVDSNHSISIVNNEYLHPFLKADIGIFTQFTPQDLEIDVPFQTLELFTIIKIERITNQTITLGTLSFNMRWKNKEQLIKYISYLRMKAKKPEYIS